ncbi:hypothetical protein LNQ03_28575 [Klebsiella pneumoniae subsp. pneumoniae]|nr:hypothetical protein [Klebsiella pneumoniae subsp. pneumoniae]
MLFTASLMVIPGPRFLSLTTLALLIIASGLFVAFVVRCRRVNNPVLELSLLRHPRFCRRTVVACRHLLLLRGPADYCSTAFYGRERG